MLAAHYRRVSTGEQMDSLDDQEKRCLLYCSPFNQLEVPPGLSFPDPAVSRTTPLRDRKGGAALMNRLALGDVHHLIIAKLDRLGANARDMLEVFQWLKDHHVTLHIIDLGGDTVTTRGYYGKLILHMLVGLAEFEVDQLRDRTQTKMRELFNSGQLTGKVPFGYDCLYTFANGQTHLSGHALSPLELSEITGDQLWLHPEYKRRPKAHKQLRDNPAEQAVIRSMAAWRASGWKLEPIAARLNALGQPTKLGCRWSAGNVDSVLKSRHTAQVLARSAGGTSLEAAA